MARDNSSGSKGWYCGVCHYGSQSIEPFVKCPQCGAVHNGSRKPPFPPKPLRHGSGNPNGKTESDRHHLKGPTGTPQKKITDKLARRRKADSEHKATHSQHTVPGSMKKGGGY